MTATIFEILENAPYGAYGIDLSQTIVYWNPQAEAILGYAPRDVLGKKCYEAMQNLSIDDTEPVCKQNCPAIVATKSGRIPPVADVRMLSASGARKRVTMFSIIATDDKDQVVLIHMFHEPAVVAPDENESPPPRLSAREAEILSMLALGLRPVEIAERLFISVLTVRKHISNAGDKLHTHSMMAAVLAAQHRHLI